MSVGRWILWGALCTANVSKVSLPFWGTLVILEQCLKLQLHDEEGSVETDYCQFTGKHLWGSLCLKNWHIKWSELSHSWRLVSCSKIIDSPHEVRSPLQTSLSIRSLFGFHAPPACLLPRARKQELRSGTGGTLERAAAIGEENRKTNNFPRIPLARIGRLHRPQTLLQHQGCQMVTRSPTKRNPRKGRNQIVQRSVEEP